MTEQLTEQTEETAPESTEEDSVSTADGTETPAEETAPEPKTYDESYVKTLRKESAGYREKAKRVDELGARLHTALVKTDGRLQDPSDLPYELEHLDDPEALTAAIDALLTAKPHLASRRPAGFIPQGATAETGNGFSLAGMLRKNAG